MRPQVLLTISDVLWTLSGRAYGVVISDLTMPEIHLYFTNWAEL